MRLGAFAEEPLFNLSQEVLVKCQTHLCDGDRVVDLDVLTQVRSRRVVRFSAILKWDQNEPSGKALKGHTIACHPKLAAGAIEFNFYGLPSGQAHLEPDWREPRTYLNRVLVGVSCVVKVPK